MRARVEELQDGLGGVPLDRFVDPAKELLGVFSGEGTIVALHVAWEAAGFDREAMVGTPLVDWLHPDDRGRTDVERERNVEVSGHVEAIFDNRWRRRDGEHRWLRWRTFSDDAGCLYAAGRDVTAERAALEEREALAAIVDSSGDAIYRRDGRGVVRALNGAGERLLGLDAAEAIGRHGAPGVRPDDAPAETERFHRALAGEVQAYEGRRVHRDGTEVPVAVTMSPVRDGDGVVRSVSVSLRDVSERRRAERERSLLVEDLQRSNDDLTQFAYVASHDLSEPLRSIGGFLTLLQHRYEGELDERGQEYIERAVAASGRMRDLIDDLLAYARTSRDALEPRRFELAELVRTTLESHRQLLVDTGATVEVDELPELVADEGRVGQVLDNLVTNALKFHAAEAPPRLRISAERVAAAWEVRVDDAGIGIEERHRERVFEIFKRLHGGGAYAGTGIGLSVCKSIVERGGGRIRCDASPLGGSRFAFTVPDPA